MSLRRWPVGLLVLIAAGLAWPAAATASARPDLTVKSLGGIPASIAAGRSFSVTDVTANVGTARASASKTSYLLSRDASAGSGDIGLGARDVSGLAAGASSRGSRSVTVPAATKIGSYRLIACADSAKRVAESSEGNNCRASASDVVVLPPPGYFPRPAKPLTVSPTLQPSRADSKRIGTGGGTVAATAANGTRFTLTVPPKALLSDETVTLTPVAAIGNLPLSQGLIGAVEIRPHGLQLLRPATLAIQPPSGTPVTNKTGFLANQGGQDFQLEPLAAGTALKLSLTHFSTPGAGRGTAADAAQVTSRMPVRTQAQYESLAGDIVKRLGQSDEAIDELAALSAAYYRDIVKPLADKALTDDSYAEEAVSRLIAWERQMELLGLTDHFLIKPISAGIWDRVEAILRNAVNKSYARCTNHDLSEVVRLISFERTAQLTGLDLGNAMGKAEKCAHFEVDFDVQVTLSPYFGDEPETAANIDYQALDVPLSMSGPMAEIQGQKPLANHTWTITDNDPCTDYAPGAAVNKTPFAVKALGLDYNVTERRLPDGKIVREVPPPTVAMLMDPGQLELHYELWSVPGDPCDGDGVHRDGPALNTGLYWLDLHQAEWAPTAGYGPYVYRLTSWGTPSGALIGRRTYSLTNPASGVSETTTIDLYHRPQ